jgi:hypothetical protein
VRDMLIACIYLPNGKSPARPKFLEQGWTGALRTLLLLNDSAARLLTGAGVDREVRGGGCQRPRASMDHAWAHRSAAGERSFTPAPQKGSKAPLLDLLEVP